MRIIALLVVAIAATSLAGLGASAPAAGERESWHDVTGADQGVSFTRDITHTGIPTFFDARATSFTCEDGSSFDDPLVVISAGDGSGSDLGVKIGSDGSFSYSGQATWSQGSGTISFQGKFAGDTASGTVQWSATRPTTTNGNCTGSAGPAQWTARCVEQCGGTSTGAISVAINGKALIGQWALVDVSVTSDGTGRIVAFAHHDGARACGTFAAEDGAAAPPHRHGAVERLGEAQVPGPGKFVFHGKYIPDQFGKADRICAYLTQAPAGDTVLAQGEGTPKIGFALPWSGTWGAASSNSRSGIYHLATPYKDPAKGTSPGIHVLGSWGCDGGVQRADKLAGRRWWIGNTSLGKAITLTPVRPAANGSFSYSGAVHPDFSNNYDHPIPKKWPARTMHVSFSGRFTAGHARDGSGMVTGGRLKLLVVSGAHRCVTTPKLKGQGALSELPVAVENRYSGTITSG